ncbi:MAG TPA: AMP-binding protein, partial [Acidimicrobiales bacterium]|nr:AMP-binding protein [Acidimicrobiales bacterium]
MSETFNACAWLVDRRLDAGHGSRVAVRVGSDSVTYAELLDQVQAAANGLRMLDVRPEERILMVLLDGVEFLATFLGAMRIGAVPVPVNPQLRPGELARLVHDARARVAVLSRERQALAPSLAGISRLVMTGSDGEPGGGGGPAGAEVDGWAVMTAEGGAVDPYPAGEDFPGFWLCTGGTTGHPKLAMHRHGDLPVTVETYSSPVLGVTAEDRVFSVGPMFHAYGLGNS